MRVVEKKRPGHPTADIRHPTPSSILAFFGQGATFFSRRFSKALGPILFCLESNQKEIEITSFVTPPGQIYNKSCIKGWKSQKSGRTRQMILWKLLSLLAKLQTINNFPSLVRGFSKSLGPKII